MVVKREHKTHVHYHQHNSSGRNLLIATLLNLFITVAESVGGILTNSLALLSDAMHNLGDTFAIFIAYLAYQIGKKPSNYKKTFGFKRAEILAALFNTIILIVISIYLLLEAYRRLMHPEPIKSLIMISIAAAGFLANLVSILILHKTSKHSLNIKAAYLHLLSDTLSSVVVILGGIIMLFFELYWFDSVITVVISIYILIGAYKVLKQTVNILMQSVPSEIDIKLIKNKIEAMDEIANIHHLHAWNLTDESIHFECHIDLENDIKISDTDRIKEKIENLLKTKFGINHTTLQFEYNCCDNKELIHNG